ncbi:MAG: hypothetical protein HC857_06325 [Synechococcales cyanobacterium RU_4_20]|nr:hypothetical protein [Synechococcales cyanobacterium RU_4_20]NJR69589.1 hypothetical protein [Synechococcales cyanobacterium CRU_2_2]
MEKLKFSSLCLADLKRVVQLQEGVVAEHAWSSVDHLTLNPRDQEQAQLIAQRLLLRTTNLMNEATIWAKAIFPLLVLAEQPGVEAWAEIALKGVYKTFEIEGIADGVLAKSVAGRIEAPYLVVVETKKGVEGENPVFQLYGQLLAAAYQDWLLSEQPVQEMFGCYTIGDSWQFVRAEVSDMETDRPRLTVEYSREYVEKLEAETILKILKGIVQRGLAQPQRST